jgi:IS5 family transposase
MGGVHIKKHGKNHFGYKLHASADKRYKFICKLAVTHAAVSDTTVFEELLDPTNTSRDVYADRGYASNEREAEASPLASPNTTPWPCHPRHSDAQKRRNHRIATPSARVEHVIGALAQVGGKLVRCMSIVRTTFARSLEAASYKLKPLVFLKEHSLTLFEIRRPRASARPMLL